MGDKKEYAHIADFKAYMDNSSFESYNTGDIWTIKYQSGEDIMEMNIDTVNMILAESYINSEPISKIPFEYEDDWYKTPVQTIDPEKNIRYYA